MNTRALLVSREVGLGIQGGELTRVFVPLTDWKEARGTEEANVSAAPQDDTVGEPIGSTVGSHNPTLWHRVRAAFQRWQYQVKRRRQIKAEINALLPILRHGNERELRGCKVPFPRSLRDVQRIVEAVTKRQHDYGTCVYAMSISAEAAFNYVSHELGCTGFQASCADLNFLSRTRHMEHGFQIINYDNLLYPQYADKWPSRSKVIEENIDELGKAAEKKLAESIGVHPNVARWWEDLIDMRRIHLASKA
jgi:hypothetical protein